MLVLMFAELMTTLFATSHELAVPGAMVMVDGMLLAKGELPLALYPRKVYLCKHPEQALMIGLVVVGPDVVELLSMTVKMERPSGESAISLKRFILRNNVLVSLVFPLGHESGPAAFRLIRRILPPFNAPINKEFFQPGTRLLV